MSANSQHARFFDNRILLGNDSTVKPTRRHTRAPTTLPLDHKQVMMCIHTRVNSRDVIASLQADGWRQVGQKGSHVQFKHPSKPGRVTVPHPTRNLPIGTLRGIESQAGLKLR